MLVPNMHWNFEFMNIIIELSDKCHNLECIKPKDILLSVLYYYT